MNNNINKHSSSKISTHLYLNDPTKELCTKRPILLYCLGIVLRMLLVNRKHNDHAQVELATVDGK
jgi:hypothetical protein